MNDYIKIIDIAKTLGLTPPDLKLAYDFWIAESGSDEAETPSTPTIIPSQPRPSYHPSDITAAFERDRNLKALYKLAQTLLGKTLSTTEVQILYSLYDYYGFPIEVAMEMLTYAAKIDKRNMRYIEKIAIDWAENGIFTHEDAEKYIKKLEQRAKREYKIKQLLGLNNRELTDTEKKFIGLWANDMRVPFELVPLAYERTINATDKLSCKYMHKIFENWAAAGIKTVAQVEAQDADWKAKSQSNNSTPITTGGIKPSKFNNFAGTSGIDYTAAAKSKINQM